MVKRKVMIVVLLLFIAAGVWATSLDDLVTSAMENSQTIKTLDINKRNTELSWQSEDLEDDKVSVTISTGDITIQKEADGNTTLEIGANPLSITSIEVSLPETDDTTISFGLNNKISLSTSGERTVTLTPKTSISKEISLDTFTDNREDITTSMNRAQQTLSYQESLLKFKRSVIESVIAIIQAEVSLYKAQSSYDRALDDYSNDLLSGSITEGNLKDLKAQMNLESLKVTLESTKTKYQSLLDSFKDNYGIDYVEPSEIREADLTLEENPRNTTSVLVADYALEIAKQDLDVATGTARSMVLGASADTPFTYNRTDNGSSFDNLWTSGINGAVSANMSASNYSLGAKAGASYEYDFNESSGEFIPYITLTGKWTNKTTTEKDDLEIQTLRNKVILAQMDYDDAIEAYNSSVKDIQQDIEDLETEIAQFEISARYNSLILESTQEMCNLGLSTQRDLEDAQTAVNNDAVQRVLYSLQALLIENDIAILQL